MGVAGRPKERGADFGLVVAHGPWAFHFLQSQHQLVVTEAALMSSYGSKNQTHFLNNHWGAGAASE